MARQFIVEGLGFNDGVPFTVHTATNAADALAYMREHAKTYRRIGYRLVEVIKEIPPSA